MVNKIIKIAGVVGAAALALLGIFDPANRETYIAGMVACIAATGYSMERSKSAVLESKLDKSDEEVVGLMGDNRELRGLINRQEQTILELNKPVAKTVSDTVVKTTKKRK